MESEQRRLVEDGTKLREGGARENELLEEVGGPLSRHLLYLVISKLHVLRNVSCLTSSGSKHIILQS
jgi:hypothetical protein